MKKRLLALCLAVVLLLGMMPVRSFATDTENEPSHQAAYAGAIAMDGSLSESAWNAYGKITDGTSFRCFDVLWDAANLYIGLKPEAADTAFTVTAADKTLTVDKTAGASGITGAEAVWADAVEVKIPLESLRISVNNYGQSIAARIAMGAMAWEGDIELNSTERSDIIPASSFTGTHNDSTTNLKTEVLADGGFHWSRAYEEGVPNSADYLSYFQLNNNPILNQGVKGTSVEFDFQMHSVPVDYTVGYNSSAYITFGFSLGYMSSKGSSSAQESVSFGITGTAGKMYAMIGFGGGGTPVSVDTGKKLGEKFHVQLMATHEGAVQIYIDGVLVGTVENAVLPASHIGGTNTGNSLIRMSQYSRQKNQDGCAPDGSMDCSFSLWNFNISTFQGIDVMDSLTWDSIKGDNISSDKVVADLVLPANLENTQIPGLRLNWASSEPEIIGNDGKVGTSPVEKQVTLTATIADSTPVVSKSFPLTVPALTISAALLDDSITLDGLINDAVWSKVDAQPFSVSDGITGAQVSGLWNSTTIYLAVEYGTATTMDLQFGDKTWEDVPLTESISNTGLSGCAKNGTAELAIDLAAIGVVLEDYNEVHALQISLSDGSGNTASIEEAPVNLLLFGLQMCSDKFVGSIQGNGQANTSTVNSLGYSMTRDMGDVIDYTKMVQFSAKLNITKMDVFTQENGGFVPSSNILNPYGLAFFLFHSAAGDRGDLYGGSIYNNGTSLVFRGYNGETVDLGVTPGSGFFELSYTRYPDDTADIRVNGERKGSLSANVAKNVSMTNRRNVMSIRAWTPETGKNVAVTWGTVTVYNVGEERRSLDNDLAKELVLNGITLSDLVNGNTFTLPDSFETGVGTFDLEWVSENDCVELTKVSGGYEAAITQPDTRVNAYSKLTMSAKRRGGSGAVKLTWNTEASVQGLKKGQEEPITTLRVSYTAADMTVNGLTTEEGWSLNTNVLRNGLPMGSFGAQWKANHLYLAVKQANSDDDVTVTVNGKVLSGGVSSGNVTEYACTFADLEVAITNYGQEIPATIQIGEAAWTGTLVIISNDRFVSSGYGTGMPYHESDQGSRGIGGGQQPTANQGVQYIAADNHWYFYDKYDPMGNNPHSIRTYRIFAGGSGVYAPLNDRSMATYTEFEIQAMAMPVYTAAEASGFSVAFANYGLSWMLAGAYDANSYSDLVSMGIYNSPNGLMLCVLGESTTHLPLNKYLGDKFRLATSWNPDGSLTVYLDDVFFAHIEKAQTKQKEFANQCLVFNLIRSPKCATGSADSFEVYVSNLNIGKTLGDSVMDQLTWDTIRSDNTDMFGVTNDLDLVTSLTDEQLDLIAPVQWTSSDESVIDTDGTVTRPEKGGKLVTLAARWNGTVKTFEVYVKGITFHSDVWVVENDLDPATGQAVENQNYFFTLDQNNNSLVLDQGESKRVSVLTLTDGDDVNRLNESNLTIWVSEDGTAFTKVDGFKLMKQGKSVYLYGFVAEGRYVKVHFTDRDSRESDFTAPLGQMLKAEFQEVFGADGAFAHSDTVTVTNEKNVTLWDDHYTISTTGIGTVKSDKSDVRFFLDGELLYHYYNGENFVVRIPKIAANSSVELTVLSGNADAMKIDNKEYTLEVVYGTREIISGEAGVDAGRWITDLPDGRIISIQSNKTEGALKSNHLTYSFSYDGGMTWTEQVMIPCTLDWVWYAGGVVYDPNNGRIIVQGYTAVAFSGSDVSVSDSKLRLVYSDDFGETWTACPEVAMEGKSATYVLSYTDPELVPSYDGEGPNVDMVLCTGVQYDNNGSFCCRVAYSCDAGKTWTLGKDEIIYTAGEGTGVMEGGISEATIMAKKNEPGTLVLLARCQYENMDFFAKSYSYDYGKTWQTHAVPSGIYTPNTQPVLHSFGGEQILIWGGNNVMGGDSYHRTPLNVAISYDGLESFVNIQDLYARTSLQNLTVAGRNRISNASIANYGDGMTIIWDNQNKVYNVSDRKILRIEDFTNWFYRTKGVYDSFEHNTFKSEGWEVITGAVMRSNLYALDGSYSAKMSAGTSLVRSVPYLQKGEVSFGLYLDADSVAAIQLESAYSNIYGKAAPIAFELKDGKIYFLGSSAAVDVDTVNGWNLFTIEVDLTAETPVAKLYLNGEEAADVPVDPAKGDYISWLGIDAPLTDLYLDDVQIVDNDMVRMPDACHLGHTLTKVDADPADCENDGTIEHWECEICGKLFSDSEGKHEITDTTDRAKGHNLIHIPATAATADKEGNKEYYICEYCEKAFWDAEGNQPIADLAETVLPKVSTDPDAGDYFDLIPLTILLVGATMSLAVMVIFRKKWMK